MQTVVQTQALTRRFGKQVAVDAIDLRVRQGEVYGFLGLNGAGKTTTIRMLLGLIRPTSGSIEILGHPVPKERVKVMGRVGSLVESPSYYAHLTGRENLKVLATLLAVPDTGIDDVLSTVGLSAAADKKAGKYSLGMKQRLGIAAALLNEPKLLVLDEPTNGLDPAGIQEIRDLIVRMPRERDITVLVSSHLLSEVDQMATTVGVIHHGGLIFQGPIDELRKTSSGRVSLHVDRPDEAHRILARAGVGVARDTEGLCLESPDREVAAFAVRSLVADDISIYRVQERTSSLESVFLGLTAQEGGSR